MTIVGVYISTKSTPSIPVLRAQFTNHAIPKLAALHQEFLYFQGQTTNACAFLLINGSLNKDKELNLTTNHRSFRAKRFA
jgi:hypothetical protein